MIVISTAVSTAKLYIKLSRPEHWLKNILVFISIVYSYNLLNVQLFICAVITFVGFCLVSSSVYVLNDIIDAGEDRNHPVKCERPIASGKVAVPGAIIFAVALCIGGLSVIAFGIGIGYVLLIAGIYVLLNIAYSIKLKHHAIIDCFCIAAGFVLRMYAGAVAIGSDISSWLFLTMVMVSLFMSFGKRRGEIMRVYNSDTTRKVLKNYDLGFINGIMFTCVGLSVVFYSLWAVYSVQLMVYTVPLVIFIICRYLLIIHFNSSHGDPINVILSDKVLILSIGIFGIISVLLLYIWRE